jgi:uncharacterized protein (TIGR00725 family)
MFRKIGLIVNNDPVAGIITVRPAQAWEGTLSRDKIQIAVIGASSCDDEVWSQARAVGRAIARAGAILVCGGLSGVMEASAIGAKEEGGRTLGILPGPSRVAANDAMDVVVATGLGHFRNFVIAQTADVFIAIAGKYGTLSEIAMALTLGKTVVGLGTWEIDGVVSASDPEEAVEKALKSLT